MTVISEQKTTIVARAITSLIRIGTKVYVYTNTGDPFIFEFSGEAEAINFHDSTIDVLKEICP